MREKKIPPYKKITSLTVQHKDDEEEEDEEEKKKKEEEEKKKKEEEEEGLGGDGRQVESLARVLIFIS